MHISGEHLGAELGYNHVTTADSEIVIWNWKTGPQRTGVLLLLLIVY